MRTFRFALHTGPALVAELAEKIDAAGINVVWRGTEQLIVDKPALGDDVLGVAWHIRADLVRKHGTDFGLRPVFLFEHAGRGADEGGAAWE